MQKWQALCQNDMPVPGMVEGLKIWGGDDTKGLNKQKVDYVLPKKQFIEPL